MYANEVVPEGRPPPTQFGFFLRWNFSACGQKCQNHLCILAKKSRDGDGKLDPIEVKGGENCSHSSTLQHKSYYKEDYSVDKEQYNHFLATSFKPVTVCLLVFVSVCMVVVFKEHLISSHVSSNRFHKGGWGFEVSCSYAIKQMANLCVPWKMGSTNAQSAWACMWNPI